MNQNLTTTDDYRALIADLKTRIRSAQIKAAVTVNSQLIALYWDIGRLIAEKQRASGWGDAVIDQIARDLSREFQSMKSFRGAISTPSASGTAFTLPSAMKVSNNLLDKFPGDITP